MARFPRRLTTTSKALDRSSSGALQTSPLATLPACRHLAARLLSESFCRVLGLHHQGPQLFERGERGVLLSLKSRRGASGMLGREWLLGGWRFEISATSFEFWGYADLARPQASWSMKHLARNTSSAKAAGRMPGIGRLPRPSPPGRRCRPSRKACPTGGPRTPSRLPCCCCSGGLSPAALAGIAVSSD